MNESKLDKVYQLFNRANGGERKAAERHLMQLLDKQGLSLDDFLASKEDLPEVRFFKFSNDFEKKLLMQVSGMIQPKDERDTFYRKPKSRAYVGFKLTKAQAVEVEFLYDTYRTALNEQLNQTVKAFIHKNNIFPPDGTKSEMPTDPLARAKVRQMLMQSEFMPRVDLRKQICGGAAR